MIVDYAWGRPTPQALRAAGATGVARYLAWKPNGKVIDRGEYQALRGAGLGVVLVWEQGAADLVSPRWSAAASTSEAQRQLMTLGAPPCQPIYFAVDLDAVGREVDIAVQNLGRVAAILSAERVGVYGPWDVLERARDMGVAHWFWQAGMSTAWSGGRNRNPFPGHLRQRRNITIDGVDCDANDALVANYGQGPAAAPMPAPPKEDDVNIGTEPIPSGYAFTKDGVTKDPSKTLALGFPAGKFSGWPVGILDLSIAGDTFGLGPIRIRVAIHDGQDWNYVRFFDFDPHLGRMRIGDIPEAKSGQAYMVSVGRCGDGPAPGLTTDLRPTLADVPLAISWVVGSR